MDTIDIQLTVSSNDAEPIERIYSGETVESPFPSNLVTPTDEQTLTVLQRDLNSSIDERLNAAKVALDYFATGKLDEAVLTKREPAGIFPHSILPELSLDFDSPVEHPAGQDANNENANKQADSPAVDHDGDMSTLSTFDSSQSFPSPHPSEIELIAEARRRSSALYSLPNAHILVDKATAAGSEVDEADNTILQEDYFSVPDDPEPTPDLLFSLSWPADFRTWMHQLTIRTVFTQAIRVLFFLPWCITVGAAIVLFPTHLSSVGFASYFNYITPPSTAIERFAHWANYGLQYVTIFLGCVFTFLWLFPDAGLVCLGALVAQFCWAWHDFLPDRTIALGENERQMIYLLAKYTWLSGASFRLKTVDGRFYVAHSELAESSGSDSEMDESEE